MRTGWRGGGFAIHHRLPRICSVRNRSEAPAYFGRYSSGGGGGGGDGPDGGVSTALGRSRTTRADAEAEDERFYEVAARGPNGYFAALDQLSRGIGVAEVVMTPSQMDELESLRRAHRERTGGPASQSEPARPRPTARAGAAMGTESSVKRRGRLNTAELRGLLEDDASLPLEAAAQKYGVDVAAPRDLREPRSPTR